MPPAKILAASDFEIDQLVDIFNCGYQGYKVPVHLSPQQFNSMVGQNWIDLALSKVALVDETPIGIGLLAKRSRRGWIGGLGVAPEHRRRGIGRLIMESLLDTAWEESIENVQLEVINGNQGAFDLYEQMNFVVKRQLLIFGCDNPNLTPLPQQVAQVPAGDALMLYHEFHQTDNPWQREFESLHHLAPGLTGWLALHDQRPLAYVVGFTENGLNLVDLAYAEGESAALAGLVSAIHQQYPGVTARVINIPQDDPVCSILSQLGYQPRMSQSEMHIQF